MKSVPVGILGGGIAGLALAHRLHARGVDFELFESGRELGGMARTLQFGAFRVDTGAHRFHDKDPEITEWVGEVIGGEWSQNHTRSAIYRNRRYIDFPLAPLNVLANVPFTTGVGYVWDFLRRPNLQPDNLRDHALSRFGKSLADDFILKYSQKLWGVPTEKLSLELGTARLQKMSLVTVVKEMFFGSRKKNVHLDGSFYYPLNGYGRITDSFLAALPPERLHTACPVTGVERLAGGGYRVSAGGEDYRCRAVVAAMPITDLARMADWLAPELAGESRALRHRHVVSVFVTLNKPAVSPHASLYMPNEKVQVTRLHEPRNRCRTMAPEGQTSLLAEVPLDDPFPAPDAREAVRRRVQEQTVAQLVEAGLFKGDEVLEAYSALIHNAYPVIVNEILPLRKRLVGALEAHGDFFCLGRAARFEYSHLHQIFRQAFDVAAQAERAAQVGSAAGALPQPVKP